MLRQCVNNGGHSNLETMKAKGDVLGSIECLGCGYSVEITKEDFIGEDVQKDLCEVWNDLSKQ